MKLRHLSVSFALLACAALSLPAPSSADEVKWPRRLVISVPTSGNVVHMIVSAMGKVIEDNTPIERVIVQPIGGPASWLHDDALDGSMFFNGLAQGRYNHMHHITGGGHGDDQPPGPFDLVGGGRGRQGEGRAGQQRE